MPVGNPRIFVFQFNTKYNILSAPTYSAESYWSSAYSDLRRIFEEYAAHIYSFKRIIV